MSGEPRHGYEMRQELLTRGLVADPSSVYRNLRDMEDQGLLVSRWSDRVAGPRRRMYEITAKGRDELERSASVLATARKAQNAFLRAYKSAAGS